MDIWYLFYTTYVDGVYVMVKTSLGAEHVLRVVVIKFALGRLGLLAESISSAPAQMFTSFKVRSPPIAVT